MKTKVWIILFVGLLAVCGTLSLWLLRPARAVEVEVWSEGKLIQTLPLAVDRTLAVETVAGKNIVTVSGGKVAVTEANCPDHYCMDRGWCSGGAQIVCLPNRLVLKFTGQSKVDGAVG